MYQHQYHRYNLNESYITLPCIAMLQIDSNHQGMWNT